VNATHAMDALSEHVFVRVQCFERDVRSSGLHHHDVRTLLCVYVCVFVAVEARTSSSSITLRRGRGRGRGRAKSRGKGRGRGKKAESKHLLIQHHFAQSLSAVVVIHLVSLLVT
jgi:hypothetical protein